ncbi:MAG TPA: acyl-CoA dehydrogenase family protein [Acidimicrobiia bacterium]|nr:acyl-CoA dehydrogenase family protein [Acidimicrobiia bacterium]
MRRDLYEPEHELFRQTVAGFMNTEVVPHRDRWEDEGKVDKAMFRKAGQLGLLGMAIPERYGGGGIPDFRFNAVILEEVMRADVMGAGMCITLHNDVALPYFLHLADDGQKERWLPGLASGELMSAIAMTEPGAGSDLAGIATTAIRDGDHYIVNGSKTFITNGINSDVVVTAVKTDPTQRHAGMSLVVVEAGMEGFTRGRNLDKIGLHAQDTAELFFQDVAVPVANRLGDEGRGFYHLVANLPQERLSLAVGSLAHAQQAFEWTLAYIGERKAFGSTIGSNQAVKHRMAEMRTELDVTQTYLDRQVLLLNEGALSAEDAAKAKWWATELEKRVIDSCLQFFGGWGYMEEYPIARAYRDARVQTIYGGTTEIMKEIIGKGLGL